MATVVCVGIAVLDLLFQMDELPAGGGKYYATAYREVGGGVAANAAVAVAALGGNSRYVGRVGADPVGSRIVAGLAASHVDVSGVEIRRGVGSPLSAVLVDAAGERIIINHTSDDLFAGDDPGTAGDIEGADAVLVDVRWPVGAVTALQAAASAGIPAVFDFDRPMADGGANLLDRATHVVCSQAALAATTGTDDPEAGLRELGERTTAWLAVTAGGAGMWWLDGGDVHHLPAFPVDVVDTVGAGDVFHGAFALALAEGSAAPEAARFASAAAALKCSRPGGREGTPGRHEVEALLKGRG